MSFDQSTTSKQAWHDVEEGMAETESLLGLDQQDLKSDKPAAKNTEGEVNLKRAGISARRPRGLMAGPALPLNEIEPPGSSSQRDQEPAPFAQASAPGAQYLGKALSGVTWRIKLPVFGRNIWQNLANYCNRSSDPQGGSSTSVGESMLSENPIHREMGNQ